jgi:hypothetical protein
MDSITFVLFSKYYPIVDQLGSKDSSRDFQLNCVISYFFTYIYYFMHGSKDWCDGERVKKFNFWGASKQGLVCLSLPFNKCFFRIMTGIEGEIHHKLANIRCAWIRDHCQNSGLLLIFLSSSKTISLVIAYENLIRRHLVGKIYTKF